MVFSSLTFLYCFLPICVLLYFVGKSISYKNWLLLIFSIFFYAWGEPIYVLLMMISAGINYGAGLLIGRFETRKSVRIVLVTAIVVNLGLLGFFKYAGWMVENFNAITGLALQGPKVTLPIGISFYTFQALSYVIDVYRGDVAVQRSYKNFLLYVSLFPQLIAGPIVRYSEIEVQLAKRKISLSSIYYGLTRFCIGLGKKVLIANYAAKIADQLLTGETASMTTLGTWLGIIFFTFQIYFDFSGYSDMAIGLGRVFGFKYAENFNLPYISRSITEFWRRWHISLSGFFRDYVYIPLGGNRKHKTLNLFLVWTLTGLWHGASWNFVLWGMYFFVLLYIEKKITNQLAHIPGFIRQIFTMLLVVLGWTLFYFTDLGRLGQTLGVMFGFTGQGFTSAPVTGMLKNNLLLLLVCVIGSTPLPRYLGLAFGTLCTGNKESQAMRKLHAIVVFVFNILLLALTTISLIGSSYNPFLYFRF